MSALGQKQTFAVQNGTSALPPKANIPRRLFNHLIGQLRAQGGQAQTKNKK
jgi:hypothetical protein